MVDLYMILSVRGGWVMAVGSKESLAGWREEREGGGVCGCWKAGGGSILGGGCWM